MNLARYNQNGPDSNPGLALGAPALPGNALRFWDASRRLRTAAVLAALGALLADGRPAAAQTTNAPAVANATNYSSFQIIVERNIFDPSRYARAPRSRGRSISRSAPYFSLVGTMSSRQGMLAFFDGNDSDYRKVLSPGGVIVGYKVVEITLHGVKLEAAGKPVVMKVGAQMRQAVKGEWQLAESGEWPAATAGSEAPATDETPAAGPDSGSAGEPNDVLKKLMQQREQELK
jgi:hypothetical protein